MTNIELPKDAEGREIPLDTDWLYGYDGSVYKVRTYCCAVDEDMPDRKWEALLFGGKSAELRSIRTTTLYLTPPDTWAKLDEDLGRGADALNYEACAYFGKSACDCSSCIADKGETCERVVMRDILNRIRKLTRED